jgi:hypothetical protein
MNKSVRNTAYAMVASGLAVCVLAAGSDATQGAAKARPTTAQRSTATATAAAAAAAATLAGNRELARKQAAWLLTHVRMPPGAVRLKSAPASLPGPAMGTPQVRTLIDTVRSWRVKMPFARMVTWLNKHRPRGLPETGSSSASYRGRLTMVGYDYGGRTSPAWESSDLEIAVAPAGKKASVIRADGVVVYLDPRPIPDNAKGPRLRVTLARGCPRSDAGIVGVRNRGPGLRHRLLPRGKPTAGLVCRYNGLNGKAFRLRKATRLDAAQARRLARSMSRLPLSHTDGGVVNCPFDDLSYEVVALAYPHRSDVDLWVKLNGCTYVANGFILAGAYF